jgi:hypothetical protein
MREDPRTLSGGIHGWLCEKCVITGKHNPPCEWPAQQSAAASYLFLTNRLDDLFAASFFA